MKINKPLVSLAFFAAIFSVPAKAQQEIQIDPETIWTHPHSEIEVPPSLGGLPRAKATEFAPDFLNLGFSFRGPGKDELSLYIYRDTNGGVPVWLEQARQSIEARDIYKQPQLAFGIEQYAWPGSEIWQGQRAVYETPDSTYSTSTGVALFSIKGWFVKVRATSDHRSASELAQWIDGALAEIVLPQSEVSQSPLIAVEECDEKLSFKKKAKDAKVDQAAGLLGSLLGGIVAEKVQNEHEDGGPKKPVAWCRDASLGGLQIAYRANASTDSYLIALGDSGMGVSVGRDDAASLLDSDKKAGERYAITVITDSQRISYTPQNRLPSLQRVMEVINDNKRISAVSTWGKNSTITINSDS